MTDLDDRLASLELKVENAFALNGRLKATEDKLSSLSKSSVRDWLTTLGPYATALMTLFIGYWINGTVSQAMQRDQLDLQYGQQVRDLVKEFDSADTQGTADANAIGLAMFGRRALLPLLERLEGGDVAHLAAEKGLLVIAANDPAAACSRLTTILQDRGHRFAWQTHKSVIRILGQSGCLDSAAELGSYQTTLQSEKSEASRLKQFGTRFSNGQGFDAESAEALLTQLRESRAMLGTEST